MNRYIELLFEGEYDKADELMRSMIPGKLYKFVPIWDEETRNERKFQSLEEKALFFSTVNKVNDPYEFKGIYLTEEDLVNQGWTGERAREILSQYDPGAWFSIACLSENDEHHLPMWAYYTNAYRGFCIEYSVDDPAKIYKVIYHEKRLPGAMAVSELLHAHGEDKEKEADYILRLLKIALYMKHVSWNWENEFRILNPLPEGSTSGSKVALSQIGLSTTRVIAGINCKPEHQQRLRNICREQGFEYNRAFISKTAFGFEEA